ncbi:MAG: Crp/Fnr family transcriptional regulator [Chitinophagales bacterium]
MKNNILQDKFINQFSEPELKEAIQKVAQFRSVSSGDTIIDKGEYIKFVPIILKGTIKVSRENEEGEEVIMYFIGPGETCSMSLTCCLQSKNSGILAVAEDNVEIMTIPIQNVQEWIGKFTSWRNFIFMSYQNRFDELLNTIDSLAFKKLDERLIEYLKTLSEKTDSNFIQATHQKIATDLNASREAISRLLKKMEQEKKIMLSRNKIELLFLKP